MEKPASGPRPMGLLSALLAFALSAAMGVAFVMVVDKTHDLFSSAAFADWVPYVATSLGWDDQAAIVNREGWWHDAPAVAVTGREDS